MDRFLSYVMYGFAILTFIIALSVLDKGEWNCKENRLFAGIAFGSSVWSFGFGLLLVQSSVNTAYFLRCIGMVGTFAYLVFATFLIVYICNIDNIIVRVIKWFTLSCIILYPFLMQKKNTTFAMSPYGMSYTFCNGIWNDLYITYCIVVALSMLYIVIYMYRKKKRKWMHIMSKRLIFCEIVIIFGMSLDTILPVFGIGAFPGSSISQSFGTLLLYQTFLFFKRNCININNMSKFVYYSLETPVLIYDEDEKLRIVNKSAIQYFNLPDECEDIKLDTLFSLDKDVLSSEGNIIKVDANCKIKHANCRLGINKILDKYKEVQGYIIIVDDLTDKINVIEELEDARMRADVANKAKSDFLARMSHEIRSPLNGVIGMNEMILRETEDPKILEYGNFIKKSSDTLLALVKDILDISKLEEGKLRLIDDEYELEDVLRDSINMLTLLGEDKGLEIKTNISANLPIALYGDRLRIKQVITNLSSNAVKYTEKGKVVFSVSHRRIDDEHAEIIFQMEDTGRGILKEDMDKLFAPYERLDEKKNQNIEGHGLGLAITKDLVKLMDGRMDVESTYGVGSKFTICVIQKVVKWKDDSVYNEDSGKDGVKNSFIAPDARILVVDDMPSNLFVVQELLKRTQIKVDLAKRGTDCLKMIEKKQYQIIFLDHMMPEMDGIELLGKIKERKNNPNSKVPIISMTANAVVGSKEMYLDAGFTDYISKPIDYKGLENMILKYLSEDLYTVVTY